MPWKMEWQCFAISVKLCLYMSVGTCEYVEVCILKLSLPKMSGLRLLMMKGSFVGFVNYKISTILKYSTFNVWKHQGNHRKLGGIVMISFKKGEYLGIFPKE